MRRARSGASRNDAAENHIKNGDEEQVQRGGGDHTSKDGRTDGDATCAACALREDQRKHAQNERQRSHQNGAQANARGFHGGFRERESLGAQLLGEFDDQNGVLAGKADEHDQPNLAVDVILESAQSLRAQRSEQRYGHGEQHDKRQHVTFILRGERQVNDHESQRKQNERFAAGLDFFERQAAPFEGHAVRQYFFRQRYHRSDAFAGTVPRRGRAVDFRRAKQIVVANDLRIRGLLHADKIVERNHFAGVRAQIIFADIFGL